MKKKKHKTEKCSHQQFRVAGIFALIATDTIAVFHYVCIENVNKHYIQYYFVPFYYHSKHIFFNFDSQARHTSHPPLLFFLSFCASFKLCPQTTFLYFTTLASPCSRRCRRRLLLLLLLSSLIWGTFVVSLVLYIWSRTHNSVILPLSIHFMHITLPVNCLALNWVAFTLSPALYIGVYFIWMCFLLLNVLIALKRNFPVMNCIRTLFCKLFWRSFCIWFSFIVLPNFLPTLHARNNLNN